MGGAIYKADERETNDKRKTLLAQIGRTYNKKYQFVHPEDDQEGVRAPTIFL